MNLSLEKDEEEIKKEDNLSVLLCILFSISY